METLERRGESAIELNGPPAGNPGGGNLDAARQDVDQFHHAGANAIEQALSHDSLGFMHAVRQEQGQ